jgi:hypothetical protein
MILGFPLFAEVAHLSFEEIGHQALSPTDSKLHIVAPTLEPKAAPERATPVPSMGWWVEGPVEVVFPVKTC